MTTRATQGLGPRGFAPGGRAGLGGDGGACVRRGAPVSEALLSKDPAQGATLPARTEIMTTGIDESKQLIGADPYGRTASLGLRVPALPLTNVLSGAVGLNRYLFMLAYLEVPAGATAVIRGARQMVKLGTLLTGTTTVRSVELEIQDPCWTPPGGNVSWHLQDLGPPGLTSIPGYQPTGPGAPSGLGIGVDSIAYRMSTSPALLYETIVAPTGYYVSLTGYTPPNGGQPWGKPLLPGGWSTRYDLAVPWTGSHAWSSLDVPVYGPRVVALFASVLQANTAATGYALSGADGTAGYPREEAFLTRFPQANYYRIAGSLVVDS